MPRCSGGTAGRVGATRRPRLSRRGRGAGERRAASGPVGERSARGLQGDPRGRPAAASAAGGVEDHADASGGVGVHQARAVGRRRGERPELIRLALRWRRQAGGGDRDALCPAPQQLGGPGPLRLAGRGAEIRGRRDERPHLSRSRSLPSLLQPRVSDLLRRAISRAARSRASSAPRSAASARGWLRSTPRASGLHVKPEDHRAATRAAGNPLKRPRPGGPRRRNRRGPRRSFGRGRAAAKPSASTASASASVPRPPGLGNPSDRSSLCSRTTLSSDQGVAPHGGPPGATPPPLRGPPGTASPSRAAGPVRARPAALPHARTLERLVDRVQARLGDSRGLGFDLA